MWPHSSSHLQKEQLWSLALRVSEMFIASLPHTARQGESTPFLTAFSLCMGARPRCTQTLAGTRAGPGASLGAQVPASFTTKMANHRFRVAPPPTAPPMVLRPAVCSSVSSVTVIRKSLSLCI